MSFAAVQGKIEKEGYGKKAAGAILAKSTRNASPAARRANPNLKHVKGGPEPKAKRHMEIEETDNGGYISKTTHLLPRDPDHGYRSNPVTTAQHNSLRALQSHVRKTFPPKSKPSSTPVPSEATGIMSKMLRGGDY